MKPEIEPLMTTAEVAAAFRVDPKTVARWAIAGRLSAVRTLGGHRRYRRREVMDLLKNGGSPRGAKVLDPPEDPEGFGIGLVTE